MTTLSDKLILFAGCTLLLYFHWPLERTPSLLALLTALSFICLCSFCNLDCLIPSRLPAHLHFLLVLLWLILGILSLIHPAFGCFLPLLFYELAVSLHHTFFIFAAGLLPVLSFREEPARLSWTVLLLFLIAWLLARKTARLLELEQEFRLLRDSSAEYHLLLQQKNRELIEKQNHEIHIATLKERNRIAREIHDNVGHMLSRSILQSGALSAINCQENLKEPLKELSSTLSLAMTSVRESVHDLHDDSIDLEASVSGLISDFPDYQISLNYDMGPFVPAQVKYCFISVIKEALSNTARHSNGREISIILREHPSLYQLMVKDNGTNARTGSSGIGISNMQERVKNLNGNFSISTEKGFRIFVSLPRVP